MKIHKAIARLFNYELIRRKKNPTVNSHIINLISLNEINMVIDVGANVGQFALMLRKEGYTGEIYSFEPVEDTFNILQAVSAGDDRWFVFKEALGDAVGSGIVHVSESSDLSSFLVANDLGKDKFPLINVAKEESVTIGTIDDFLSRKLHRPEGCRVFLKMDTQGYDLNVFNGAVKSLNFIKCMVSEVSLIPIYKDIPAYIDVLKIYQNHGFCVSGFYPVSRLDNLAVIEMDCVLVNNA